MKQDGGIVDIRAWREVSTVAPMWGGWAKPQRETAIMETWGMWKKMEREKSYLFFFIAGCLHVLVWFLPLPPFFRPLCDPSFFPYPALGSVIVIYYIFNPLTIHCGL